MPPQGQGAWPRLDLEFREHQQPRGCLSLGLNVVESAAVERPFRAALRASIPQALAPEKCH